jgi:hypothetical protein
VKNQYITVSDRFLPVTYVTHIKSIFFNDSLVVSAVITDKAAESLAGNEHAQGTKSTSKSEGQGFFPSRNSPRLVGCSSRIPKQLTWVSSLHTENIRMRHLELIMTTHNASQHIHSRFFSFAMKINMHFFQSWQYGT